MASKKFGTFGGVFTPSILTILGVIMYMRLGWVVGNAGLMGAILLIVVAHVISVTTGLSISSIATDKKVGAGGVYYVLSRSLGLPIGGAIGITLWIATALSIALYLVGFAESFNAYLNLDTSINGLRLAGSIALASLAAIAIISTSFAIKTQYFIMTAIAVSLVSIFAGTWDFAPAEVPRFGPEEGLSMMTIFAILFPAVTGFTAGIAMSGDLKDPKKSIPVGTISAIAVGFVVYVSLAVFMAYAIDPEMLRSDYNVLMKIALFAPAVVAGIWGATLSSALGGILGGPRILQAMSIDRITPKIFGKGVGKDKEPRNALLITLLIAECGVLIGELDMIAEVCSMFYLAAYGFINLSFFLESWASADFSPSFKVKKGVGLVGFIATFAVMFQLNPGAMVAAFLVIGGIYAFLQRKQIALSSGDVWTSVWSSLVMKGLHKMDSTDDTTRNWKPNILLFSGGTENRPHLIEMSKAIAGQVGMVSNFDLIENPEARVLFPKHKQSVQDPVLKEHGIFGRRQEVQNVFQGIETIARTYGFSGVEPNTIMLGWAKNTKDPIWFAKMTQTLIELDYNVLYLDYDEQRKFGKYRQIDIWWHNLKNNVELTLNIVKFISRSFEWNNAEIRVILINNTGKEGFEHKIHKMLDAYRIDAVVKVINNHISNKSSFELMESESQQADLILAGIPEIPPGQERDFVQQTTAMFESIGTTLLVKTSSTLGEDVGSTQTMVTDEIEFAKTLDESGLLPLPVMQSTEAQATFENLSAGIERLSSDLIEAELASFENVWLALLADCNKIAVKLLEGSADRELKETQWLLLKRSNARTDLFIQEDIPFLSERLVSLADQLLEFPQEVIPSLSNRIRLNGKEQHFKKTVTTYLENRFPEHAKQIQLRIGVATALLAEILKDGIIANESVFSELSSAEADQAEKLDRAYNETKEKIRVVCSGLKQFVKNAGREVLGELINQLQGGRSKSESIEKLGRKQRKQLLQELADYSQHWHRNTQMLCAKLATDVKLHGVQLINRQIAAQLEQQLNASMFLVTAERMKIAENWFSELENKAVMDINQVPQIDQALDYDDFRIQGLLSWAEEAGKDLPEKLELMQSESLNNFASQQAEQVEAVTIDASASYAHLLAEVLHQPVRKQVSKVYQGNMEILSKLQFEINSISQQAGMQKNAPNAEELKQMAINAKATLHELRTRFEQQNSLVSQQISDIIESANGAMNTSSLMSHAVRVIPKVRKSKSESSIKVWAELISDELTTYADQLLHLLSLRSNTQLADSEARPHERNQFSMHDVLRKYSDQLRIAEDVYEQIPFYYRQLFVGRQAADIDNLRHRGDELRRAKEIMQPIRGNGSGLIVLGAPLSGKSFFAESLAKDLSGGKVVKVEAPIAGSTSITDLKRTLKKLSGFSGQGKSVLQTADPETIFLFEDIELWWNRADTNHKAIRHIVELVNSPDLKGRLIISCNPYAFKIMRAQGLLDDLTLPVISMAALTQVALKEVLLERHLAGGLTLSLNAKDEAELGKRDWRRLVSVFYENSNGLTGIALHLWLNNINSCSDNSIEMTTPTVQPFPDLAEKEWLVLLGQFMIHKHLDARRVQQLFGFRDKEKADRMIRQLVADGILEEVLGTAFRLSPLVQAAFARKAESWGLI